MLPDRIFRFVQWDRLADYERIGWLTVADLGDYHGRHGVLCQWLCDCACIEPNRKAVELDSGEPISGVNLKHIVCQ
jgi:hypothetical protein